MLEHPQFYTLVLIGGLVIWITRTLPAFFSQASILMKYPRFIQFLDYAICLITGQIIYNATCNGIQSHEMPGYFGLACAATLMLAAILMYKTQNLTKSFSLCILFFMACLLVLHYHMAQIGH